MIGKTGSAALAPIGLGRSAGPGAIVLAGGRGSRMGEGEHKPLRLLGGRPLIAHVLDRLAGIEPVIVNAPSDGSFEAFGDHVAPDLRPGFQGPLAGIEAGLAMLEAEDETLSHALVLPSDTPFLPMALADTLRAHAARNEIVCAAYRGRLHPTVAIWPISLLSTLSHWLDDEKPRALRAFYEHVGFRSIDFASEDPNAHADPFANINTPDDLAAAERSAG